eukprot:3842522-Rhodomonas_salina.1
MPTEHFSVVADSADLYCEHEASRFAEQEYGRRKEKKRKEKKRKEKKRKQARCPTRDSLFLPQTGSHTTNTSALGIGRYGTQNQASGLGGTI